MTKQTTLNLLLMTILVALSMTCDNKTVEGVVTINWPETCYIRSAVFSSVAPASKGVHFPLVFVLLCSLLW
jgi:hypothetical protein